MKNPTQRQRRLIKRWRIRIPRTRQTCSRLIGFVLDNKEKSVGQHIREIRKLWRRWLGAWVKIACKDHACHGQCGRVIGMRVRSDEELSTISRTCQNDAPGIYSATVLLEDGQRLRIGLSKLRCQIQGDESRLFPLDI